MQLGWKISILFVLMASVCTGVRSEDNCLYVSDAGAMTEVETVAPYRVGYQGFYPRSSEGITATAYLDRERVARYLTLVFHGETGRATAAIRFDTESSFTMSREIYSYAKPIREGGGKSESVDSRECFVVRDGELRWSSPGADPERGVGLLQEVRLVLTSYMPCELSFPSRPSEEPTAARESEF